MRAHASMIAAGALAWACGVLVGCPGSSGGGAPDEDASTAEASPETSPGSCPNDLPRGCPSPPPSFKDRVQAIITSRCGPCHTMDGGVATSAHDFSTYARVYAQRSPILNQAYACRMPPADAGQPTPDERAALLGWLVCGAPDN